MEKHIVVVTTTMNVDYYLLVSIEVLRCWFVVWALLYATMSGLFYLQKGHEVSLLVLLWKDKTLSPLCLCVVGLDIEKFYIV